MDNRRSVDEIAERIRTLLVELDPDLEASAISLDEPLFDVDYAPAHFEIDSLDTLQLRIAIALEYGLRPDAEPDYSEITTIREIARYVHDKLSMEVSS